ncbi:MAG: hypothetical protein ACRCUE_09610 [Bosea sp. (in: a-proteobacteria)]
MSKNRLPDALPVVPVQLDLNAPGAVEKLFYGERQQPDAVADQPAEPASQVAAAEPRAPRKRAVAKADAPDVTADDFAEALERLKALGPRGERPHHVHLPDELDIALRRFAADRKTKATNILIVALMAYLDGRSAR